MKQLLSKKELIGWGIFLTISIIASIIIHFLGYPFLSALRAILGLVYVLFLPGYIVVTCFFKEVDWIEKAALSFGLSIALVILSVMISNLVFQIPITALTNFLVLLVVMIATILIKLRQKQINNFLTKIQFWKKKK